MKGKEIIMYAVRAEMPDMRQLRESCLEMVPDKTTAKRGARTKRIIPAAACLIFILAAAIAIPQINSGFINAKKTNSGSANISKNDIPIDLTMRGLPVDNFNLADVETDGAFMSRIGFMNFGSFFEHGTDCFAIVKISDVQIQKDKNQDNLENQISSAFVLQSLYKECGSDTVQILQTIFKNHFCLGTTNLLRVGGVYLLPLSKYDDLWYVSGDMDVLFEVDNEGKVWSHSNFENFNRWDGKNIELLSNEIQSMTADDDFMLANSPFSYILRNWTLADITISSKSEEKKDSNKFQYFNYSFAVNEILSESPNSSAPLGNTAKIKVFADESDEIKLVPGTRYLLFLDRFQNEISANSFMIAQVNNNETITPLPGPNDRSYIGESVFTPYNGYKISDFREMVSRIKKWRDLHE